MFIIPPSTPPPPPQAAGLHFFCPHGNGRLESKMLDSKMAAIAMAKVNNATPLLNVVHSKELDIHSPSHPLLIMIIN